MEKFRRCGQVFGFILSCLVAFTPRAVNSQTTPYWDSRFGVPGVNGPVGDIVASEGRYIIGGVFSVAGDVAASNIVSFDPALNAWSPLGGGVNGQVSSIAVDGEGQIYVGGSFSEAGGTAASNVAMWDGENWHPIGAGLDDHVRSLVAFNDLIYAGGEFISSGNTTVNGVAAWDGEEWHDLDGGVQSDFLSLDIDAMDVDDEGRLYVGGRFSSAGSISAESFAMWDGTEWSTPTPGLSSTENFGVAVYAISCANDEVYVGGSFTHAGSVHANNIALLNSTGWNSLGSGLPEAVITDIEVSVEGEVYVAGSSSLTPQSYLFGTFLNSSWTFVGPPGPQRGAHVLEIGELGEILLGHVDFLHPDGGNPSQFLYQWDRQDEAWSVLDASLQGTDGPIYAFLPDASGGLYAAGMFSFAGQTRARSIAHWNGEGWTALGDGISGIVKALAQAPNGDLYVGGRFYSSGNLSVRHIARWDGANWYALDEGVSFPGSSGYEEVNTLTVHDNKLFVGGTFTKTGSIDTRHLGVWDLSSEMWLEPPGRPNNTVLVSQSYGDGLVIGGYFGQISTEGGFNHVALWKDGVWRPMGDGSSSTILSLAMVGEVLHASGSFNDASLARWDGSDWVPLSITALDGSILEVAEDMEGRLFIGGTFQTLHTSADTLSAGRMAYLQDEKWRAVPAGGLNRGRVHALAYQHGDLIVGGEFTTIGSDGRLPSSNIAVLQHAAHLRAAHTSTTSIPQEVSVYPNPSRGPVTVEFTDAAIGQYADITVYDMTGREVYRGETETIQGRALKLPLRIPSGVYAVHVSFRSTRVVQLITVIR